MLHLKQANKFSLYGLSISLQNKNIPVHKIAAPIPIRNPRI